MTVPVEGLPVTDRKRQGKRIREASWSSQGKHSWEATLSCGKDGEKPNSEDADFSIKH